MAEEITESINDPKQQVSFIFQNKTKKRIPLVFLKKFPNSLLSLAYNNPDNFVKDKNAYRIDSPPLSIEKVTQFMKGTLSLSNIQINDVVSMYKDLKYFFGSEACEYESKLYVFLAESLKKFIDKNLCMLEFVYVYPAFSRYDDNACLYDILKEHKLTIGGPFTEERSNMFLKYSKLFELFNVISVTMQIFYFPLKKQVLVTRMDPHYKVLYKEYKRQFFEEYYPDSYEEYKRDHPDIENDKLNRDQIRVNQSVIQHEFDDKGRCPFKMIDINIDNEIKNEREELKPDLYVESISDFSSEYNEFQLRQIAEKKVSTNNLERIECSYKFVYGDDDNKDYQHPILTLANRDSEEITNYILHIPVCKHLKKIINPNKQNVKLQLHTPPLLKLLKEGYLNNITTFDLTLFLQSGSYPEHKELLKRILATYRFPNVTTLFCFNPKKWKEESTFNIEILPLITRRCFPKLHIYDITSFVNTCWWDDSSVLFDSLCPDSLLLLIDTLIVSNEEEHDPITYTVHFTIISRQLTSSWKELNETGHLLVNEIYFSFSSFDDEKKNVFIDMSQQNVKHIAFHADVTCRKLLDAYIPVVSSINCHNLETIDIFIQSRNTPYNVSYMNDFLDLFSKLNCETVKHLKIINNDTSILSDNPVEPEEVLIKNSQNMARFLSLFSPALTKFDFVFFKSNFSLISLLEECVNMPLWTNIQFLFFGFDSTININSFFQTFSTYFIQNQFLKLRYLTLGFDSNDFDIQSFLGFIDLLKEVPSGALSEFHHFALRFTPTNSRFKFIDNSVNIDDVFESFPSLSFYLHKSVSYILMCSDLVKNPRHSKIYCDYIYEQLSQDYLKNIRYLLLYIYMFIERYYIYDTKFLQKVMQLIGKGYFSELTTITLKSDKVDWNMFTHLFDKCKKTYHSKLTINCVTVPL
ncbi:hypothetical protein WA158_004010 [Blastocystis sp. Blastoise]